MKGIPCIRILMFFDDVMIPGTLQRVPCISILMFLAAILRKSREVLIPAKLNTSQKCLLNVNVPSISILMFFDGFTIHGTLQSIPCISILMFFDDVMIPGTLQRVPCISILMFLAAQRAAL